MIHSTPPPLSPMSLDATMGDVETRLAAHERDCEDRHIIHICARITSLETWRAYIAGAVAVLLLLLGTVGAILPGIVRGAVRDVLIHERVLVIQPGAARASMDFSLVPSASASTPPAKGPP